VGIVLTLPIQVAVAVAVLISSGRPIFFFQERVGEGGRLFVVRKFRTFSLEEKSLVPVNCRRDPRLTPIGHFLRWSKLDELPQFWNVLSGDMSLVGPRPVEPERVRHFTRLHPPYLERFRVRPGLTGKAQINGRRHEVGEFFHALSDDLEYIGHLPGWLVADIRILLGTLRTLFRTYEG
jgi:lipopolysaccharide/colanic/teichoic acid biosynthesis glycosyltransferase